MLTPTRPTGRGGPIKKGIQLQRNILPQNVQHKTASVDDASESRDVSSVTFLTAVKERKELIKLSPEDLRPPSPFIEPDADSFYEKQSADNYFGQKARKKFWNLFRTHDTNTGDSSRPKSARREYLKRLQNCNLMPEPLGIVRKKGKSNEIDLHSYRMGTGYGTVFGQCFGLIPGVESVNLSDNRLDDETGSEVVKCIISNQCLISNLNLSYNKLSIKSSAAIQALMSPQSSLVSLNLQHNHLNNACIFALSVGLAKSTTITRLNLSENRFSRTGCTALAELLNANQKLQELYVSWNKIQGQGAAELLQAVGKHTALRVLDISWNSLGSRMSSVAVTFLSEALCTSISLRHIDFSNNQLRKADCVLLAESLEMNQTLLGIHVMGNEGYIDPKGFLIPSTNTNQTKERHQPCSIYAFETCENTDHKSLINRSCWLCGRWSEHQFEWDPTEEGVHVEEDDVVRIHLSLDQWRGEIMQREDCSFFLIRVLPPGRTQFFMTITGPRGPVKHYLRKDKKSSRLLRRSGEFKIFGELNRANHIEIPPPDICRAPFEVTVPRPGGEGKLITKKYSAVKSIFASRIKNVHSRSLTHSKDFYSKAFLCDWKQCNLHRLFKDNVDLNLAALRESCRKYFPEIATIHRQYAAQSFAIYAASGRNADVATITWSGFSKFAHDCNLIDEKVEGGGIFDLEIIFLAANLELTEQAREVDNPDKNLTRFEFMECLMRIALARYYRTGTVDSPAVAVGKLMKEFILPRVDDNPDYFRTEYLYKKPIVDLLTEHVVYFQLLYNNIVTTKNIRNNTTTTTNSSAKRASVHGLNGGMTIHGFTAVLNNHNVFSEEFTPSHIRLPFLMSMMFVHDEMKTTDHKILSFPEFLECLVRCACLESSLSLSSTDGASLGQVLLALTNFMTKHFCRTLAATEVKTKTIVRLTIAHSLRKESRKSTSRRERTSSRIRRVAELARRTRPSITE